MAFLVFGNRLATVVLLTLGLCSRMHSGEYGTFYYTLRQEVEPGAPIFFDSLTSSDYNEAFTVISLSELRIKQIGTYNVAFFMMGQQANYFTVYKQDTSSHGLSLVSTYSLDNMVGVVSFTTTNTGEILSLINSSTSTVTLSAQEGAAFNVCVNIEKV
ncbi:MAG: hypothetical protein NTX86_01325 [Candidatus Dependentiae bacterium]|nr:hypothetical protein [Candidatus Dependentiae bacterium]